MVTFQLLWCICKSQAIPGDLPKHDLTGFASDSAEDATTLKGLVLLQKHRETNGRRMVIQMEGAHIAFNYEEGTYLCKSMAMEMGGVS